MVLGMVDAPGRSGLLGAAAKVQGFLVSCYLEHCLSSLIRPLIRHCHSAITLSGALTEQPLSHHVSKERNHGVGDPTPVSSCSLTHRFAITCAYSLLFNIRSLSMLEIARNPWRLQHARCCLARNVLYMSPNAERDTTVLVSICQRGNR